ncbi:AraC family transcriptional regulator [Vibrio sp. 10N]|uniref:AraC family transcriptional regulator n=1 Tax=Vibrio sp. 10N TaxID=3058938 RepID=UPI002813FAEB|nr:AraC family transcriptional regulator [Vibrio sp. 10N]
MEKIDYLSSPIPAINLISGRYKKFAFQKHYHLDYHFGLIVSGQQQFQLKGTSYTSGPGDLVLMPPDELHDGQSRHEEGYQVKVLTVSAPWLTQFAMSNDTGGLGFRSPIVREPELFRSLLNVHTTLSSGKMSALALDCIPLDGFQNLLDRHGRPLSAEPHAIGSQSLQRVREYIMAHLDQAIRLEQLAGLCDLSPRQFHRQFKLATGMSPHAWLTRLRLEKSMTLMKAGQSAVKVALQTGFYDQAHFSKAFRNVYGVSPSNIN